MSDFELPMPFYPQMFGFVDPEAAYPNAWCTINVARFLLSRDTRRASASQMGVLFRGLAADLIRGNFDSVASIPWVVRTHRGAQNPRSRPAIPLDVRRSVLAAGACAVCGATKRLEVDHIFPWSRGGTHAIENLQPLCYRCNRDKRAKTMEEWLA